MTPPSPGSESGSGDVPVLTHQPKAQLFGVLSVLWIFPSLGALLILGLNLSVWGQADTWGALFAATGFEHWVALLVLVSHPVFLGLSRHYRKNEAPQRVPPIDEEPPDDPDSPRPPKP